VVLLAAVVAPAGWLVLSHLARGRRWADPNPWRAGFATSTALTMLSTASAHGGFEPSYDLWLGLERWPAGGTRALRGHGDRQTAGVVGPPGSGKKLGLILPGQLSWAGAAVATSTKTDVALLAGAAREAIGQRRGGGVHLLDWSGAVGPDPGLASVCWDPLDGPERTSDHSRRPRRARWPSGRRGAACWSVESCALPGCRAARRFCSRMRGRELVPPLHHQSWGPTTRQRVVLSAGLSKRQHDGTS
jgi:hypothetical protein